MGKLGGDSANDLCHGTLLSELGFCCKKSASGSASAQQFIYPLTSHSTIRKFKRESSKKATLSFGGPRSGRGLPLALPLERTGDGARSTVGCVTEGDDQVGVRVLDPHASWPQAHVDLAAFVYAAAMTTGVRESKAHATNPLPEAAQCEAEPAFHTGAQDFSQLDVAPSNLNLHLILRHAKLSPIALSPLRRRARTAL